MNKDRRTARIIQALAIMVCLGMAVLAVQNTGLISKIGTEDIYWERARFLLGQKGATTYSGSSICSMGYSLLLVPICALIKSPYAAYKAAILLNGIFLCGSYVMAVLTAKKLFSKEKESFLSVACFFAVFCPVFSIAVFYTGPEIIELFLIWCSIFFLRQIWENGEKRNLALFILSLILLSFMQIEMLGAVLMFACLLWAFVKMQKVSETAFLKCILVLIIGVVVGDIIERIVLYGFVSNQDITVHSSLEIFVDRIKKGWENGYITGILTAIVGKIYIVILLSCLLIFPAIRSFCRDIYYFRKEDKHTNQFFNNGIILVCIVQVLFVAVYDNGRNVNVGFLSITGIATVLSPILVIGIIYLKKNLNWLKTLFWGIMIWAISALITGNVLRENSVKNITINCGIFTFLQNYTEDAVTAVYLDVCVISLIAFLVVILLKNNTIRKRFHKIFNIAEIVITSVLFMALTVMMLQGSVTKKVESEMESIAPMASILSDIENNGQGYYLQGTGDNNGIVVLQSLIPEKPIIQVKDSDEERAEIFASQIDVAESAYIITGSKNNSFNWKVQKELENFYIAYMTPSYALWLRKDDSNTSLLENKICDRAETLAYQGDETKVAKNKKVIYGKNTNLAGGTYRMEIYFNNFQQVEGLQGKITISTNEGTVYTENFDDNTICMDSNHALVLEFSSREARHNLKVQIEGSILSEIGVEHIAYRKLNATYRIGYAVSGKVESICKAIKKVDKQCGKLGDIVFVDDTAENAEDISLDMFAANLRDYNIKAVTKAELSDIEATYVIGTTESHSYYDVMDKYSIINRNSRYTVLVRNNTEQFKQCKNQGKVFSNAYEVDIKTFSKRAQENEPFSLERGSYSYKVRIRIENQKNCDKYVMGTFSIRNSDEIYAEKQILYKDMDTDTGEIILDVPLFLREKGKNIYCEIEWRDDIEATIEPMSITFLAEKYQFGKEEEKFDDLIQNIEKIVRENRSSEKIYLAIVESTEELEDQQISSKMIQKELINCKVENVDYEKAMRLTEDGLLLTYGFSTNEFKLLNKYNVIGQAGKYTLWIRNNGQLLQAAMDAGCIVKNSGNCLSVSTILTMSGERDTVNLPNAIYNITLELDVDELEMDDTVEVRILRNKTKKEIKSDVNKLMDAGYRRKEAVVAVERQKICGTGTYDWNSFNGENKKIVTIQTNNDVAIQNLSIEVFSRQGREVKGEIVWIGMK